MKKRKAISLLTILSIFLALLTMLTFARFPIGTKDFNGILGSIELDSDLGNAYAYTLVYSDDNVGSVTDIDEVTDTLKTRLSILGYKNPSIKTVKSSSEGVKDHDIVITLPASIDEYGNPNVEKLTSDVNAVKAYGELALYAGTSENPTTRILEDKEIVKGASYTGAYVDENGETKYSAVINFTSEAYKFIKEQIKTAEGESATYYLTIKLGDENILNGSLSSETFVDSNLSIVNSDEANLKQNVLKISTGGLPYIYDVTYAEVTPSLGENAVMVSAVAICVTVLFIMAALIAFYRGFGLAGALSAFAFILVEVAMLVAVPGIKLSMSGVIGIIASTILTGFGLILTSKKITAEYATGKTVKAAVKFGYKKAFRPVLLSNLLAGIAGLLIFILAGGAAINFGITLGIGAVISFIATTLLSRLYISIFMPLVKNPEKFFNMNKEEA